MTFYHSRISRKSSTCTYRVLPDFDPRCVTAAVCKLACPRASVLGSLFLLGAKILDSMSSACPSAPFQRDYRHHPGSLRARRLECHAMRLLEFPTLSWWWKDWPWLSPCTTTIACCWAQVGPFCVRAMTGRWAGGHHLSCGFEVKPTLIGRSSRNPVFPTLRPGRVASAVHFVKHCFLAYLTSMWHFPWRKAEMFYCSPTFASC